MTSNRRLVPPPSDTTDAVTREAEALVMLWDSAEDWAVPRIPPSQLRMLTVLSRQGSMNLTALARHLGAIPSSASRLCDRLEAAGLLDRQVSPHTRREVTLSVSSEGRRRLAAFDETRRRDFARVLQRMSPGTQAALLTGLRHFSEAVAESLDEGKRPA